MVHPVKLHDGCLNRIRTQTYATYVTTYMQLYTEVSMNIPNTMHCYRVRLVITIPLFLEYLDIIRNSVVIRDCQLDLYMRRVNVINVWMIKIMRIVQYDVYVHTKKQTRNETKLNMRKAKN